MRKNKAFLNFILVIIMLLGEIYVCPFRADAQEAFSNSYEDEISLTATSTDSFYENKGEKIENTSYDNIKGPVIDEKNTINIINDYSISLLGIEQADTINANTVKSSEIYIASNESKAVDYLREVMTKREPSGTVQLVYDGTVSTTEELVAFKDKKLDILKKTFLEECFKETGKSNQGDYLEWCYNNISISIVSKYLSGNVTIQYTFLFDYWQDAEKEKAVTEYIKDLLNNELKQVNEKGSDYDKVKAVYDYICKNVKYDYVYTDYSPYGALINKLAGCEGISLSIYRILKEMGIDVRFISSSTHGWNIVKLDDKYYCIDATWDLNYVGKYSYFLRGTDVFYEKHTPSDEYKTAEFMAEYPLSETDYKLLSIDKAEVKLEYNSTFYDGKNKKPKITIDGLYEDTDYIVTYENNILPGKAIVHIKGVNNYSGEKDMTFDIIKTEADVIYSTHIQSYGWQKNVKNGAVSGTCGESKRLEAIKISVATSENLDICYTTHVQSYGWQPWCRNGEISGTYGEAKRLEAIMIALSGSDAEKYDVYYRVHAQSYGWLGWAKNGEPAGTAGYAKRLEAVQIVILEKGVKIPDESNDKKIKAYISCSKQELPKLSSMSEPNVIYKTHVQTYGWQGYSGNGEMSGTCGEKKRLEGIKIDITNSKYEGNIIYKTHIQTYGWEKTWKANGEMSGTEGQAKRLEAIEIKLTGEISKYYDVYYCTHIQTYGWTDWVKNGEMSGSTGEGKRLEGIRIKLVPKNN